ncbi:MAG: NUDIX domain-containing protein [Acholeplasmataceae bacterium]|nr:NUDIX domain-containing protein [Acholeplasmataceae bacterium]
MKMVFDFVINKEEFVVFDHVKKRYAVRAIIIKKNKILMIKTSQGDYKFPGGGVIGEESHEEALKREVFEESGYKINPAELIGKVVEKRADQLEKNKGFEMVSFYYKCFLDDAKKKSAQTLDAYEKELDFRPYWIGIQHAFDENKKQEKKPNSMPWVQRETEVLSHLMINKKKLNKFI